MFSPGIWFNRVSGGVDAFFVIAAFFLMTTFAKLGKPRGRDVLRYYGSTARRVCPLAAVVLLSTIAGTLLFVPQIHWREFAFHAFASTIFVENWWLAWSGADYLRQDLAVSPFQQMWALSLQMQYYLLLPLFLWAIAEFARWRDLGVRATWTAALGTLLAVSLAYSIWVTDRNQPWAYFDSFARGWEYMFGALLALYIDRLPKVTARHAKLIGYASLMVLMGFAAVIPVASSFPGIAALIPVLATSVLIASARAGADITPLTNRPILALGDISFSFYLWHWPLLIFWRHWTGETSVGLLPGTAIILIAGLLAWATLRLIETPFRRWPVLLSRPALSVVASALLMMPALCATYLWADANRDALRTAQAQLPNFSADPQAWAETDPIVPDPLLAKSDNAPWPRSVLQGTSPTRCATRNRSQPGQCRTWSNR
nr:acyltransferase [Paracoccus rhizosphaerae]